MEQMIEIFLDNFIFIGVLCAFHAWVCDIEIWMFFKFWHAWPRLGVTYKSWMWNFLLHLPVRHTMSFLNTKSVYWLVEGFLKRGMSVHHRNNHINIYREGEEATALTFSALDFYINKPFTSWMTKQTHTVKAARCITTKLVYWPL